MSNDLTKFFGNRQNSETRKQATDALGSFASNKAAMLGDRALLRLSKKGEWVFGIDNEELPAGAVVLADPATMASGYVAWHKGQIEGEVMKPLSAGPVPSNDLKPVQAKNGWQSQVSLDLFHPKSGIKLQYKTSAVGGIRAMLNLAGDFAFAMHENGDRVYAELDFGVDSYEHKEYGTVYTPDISITGWLDADGKKVVERKRLV